MKELVILSGKGGTGKTSIVASFASLAENAVLADCDVDAADLHLILQPDIKRREEFSGGKCAAIDTQKCTGCGVCVEFCRFDAIFARDDKYEIDSIACEGCSVCSVFCPEGAITMNPAVNGEYYFSESRCGPLVHAKLGIAEENSGKLVSIVRKIARENAEELGKNLVIVDGPPGIGCPVIASVTGSDFVLIVTEPTLSGLHDLERVAELAGHFNVPAAVTVNKYDINLQITEEIEKRAAGLGLAILGRIRYDMMITRAQIEGLSIVEHAENGAARDIKNIWDALGGLMELES